MHHGKILALPLFLLVTACQVNTSPAPQRAPTGQPTPSPAQKPIQFNAAIETAGMPASHASENPPLTNKNLQIDELIPFVGTKTSILTSETGDLNADGTQDVVLVLKHDESAQEMLGEGASRSLLLLIRDEAGHLRKSKQNDKMVPCARCGGMAGDPFGEVLANQGVLTVFVEGGSRQRWSNEYRFQYSNAHKDWFLDKAIRKVVDTITTQDETIELNQSELGVISFEDFDPSQIPALDMPLLK